MPGLLPEKNGQQLLEEETNQSESVRKREQFESSLAMYINDVWNRNKRAKIDVEQRMIKSLRQRNGEYDPQKLALIQLTEGSEIFSMLTYIKCKAAEAWLSEAYSPIRGKSWLLTHTPIPDLSPDILQKIGARVLNQIAIAAQAYQEETGINVTPDEFNRVAQAHFSELKEQIDKAIKDEAKKAIGKMSEKIDDQLTEGHWERNFKDSRSDLITLGTGLIKGPTPRKRNMLKWTSSPEGEWILDMSDSIVFEYDRLSPFDYYPEDDAENIQDGDGIEYMRLSKDDLGGYIGMKGFNSKYIRAVLKDTKYGSKTERLPIDQQRSDIEGRQGNLDNPNRIDVLNYWGSVEGDLLLEWGMDESQIPDPDLNYNINAWLVVGTQYVVRAVINITGVKPYSKACFEKIPGAFWGRSLPEIVRDDQDMCNGTARAIQNNEAIASLPQTEVDVSKMIDGSNTDKIWAGRLWQTDTKGMNSGQAVRFTDCPSKVVELLQVYEKFSRGMDEKSGIPAFAHGDPKVGGSGNTASGLSIFVSMAGKIINDLTHTIDMDIVATTIGRTYNHNMMYDPNPDIKRDAKVVVRGTSSIVVKEQEEIRKSELLRDTNNPADLQIMGLEGRKELLKDKLKTMTSLDVDKVIPELPIQFFPKNIKGNVPREKEATRDVAGNPSGGTDFNQFNSVSQRGGM